MKKRNRIFLILLLAVLTPLITAYEFCEETTSENELEIIEIIDTAQTSDTDWTWKPTEQVEIEVEVKNKNFTTRNFEVELFFLDDDLDERNIITASTNPIKTISLDKGETETLNFSFQLKEPNQNTYFLYARLIDANNESICTSLRATSKNDETTITIEGEEKIIAIRNIEGPTNITPGFEAKYTVEVINLGNTKEDRVMIMMYNTNLKIKERKEIIILEVEKSKTVTFNITLPENTTSKQENFLFSAEYDYDNETDYYRQSSDKSKALLVQIETIENQITQEIKNQTTQIQTNKTITNSTQENTTIKAQKPIITNPPLKLLWIIIPSILVIMIGIALFLQFKKKNYEKTTSLTPSAATEYVEKIQKESSSL